MLSYFLRYALIETMNGDARMETVTFSFFTELKLLRYALMEYSRRRSGLQCTKLCRPLTKSELEQEMEVYQSWIRLSRVDVVGLLIFLLYVLASGAYMACRCIYSLKGLGDEVWYGIPRRAVLCKHS
jgi:hypothetical protein